MTKEEIIHTLKFILETEGDGGCSHYSDEQKQEMNQFLDDLLGKTEKDKVSFDSISCEYSQEGDCCQDRMDIQSIKFETVNNGTASFYRMSLPDGGFWSFDREEDLINLFRDFKSRVL